MCALHLPIFIAASSTQMAHWVRCWLYLRAQIMKKLLMLRGTVRSSLWYGAIAGTPPLPAVTSMAAGSPRTESDQPVILLSPAVLLGWLEQLVIRSIRKLLRMVRLAQLHGKMSATG